MALECLKQHNFPLAFVDVKLPDMDGLQLAARLREINLQVAIIMISGYYYANDTEIKQEFVEKPYMGFIAKPFNLDDVRHIAHMALASREQV